MSDLPIVNRENKMAAPFHRSSLQISVHNLSNSDKQIAKQALLHTQKFIRSAPGTEPVQHFRECGGLKRLISILKSSDLELVDLSLSVLATCCREPASRECVSLTQGFSIKFTNITVSGGVGLG